MRNIKRIVAGAVLGVALASTAGCYSGGGYGGSDEYYYDEYGYDARPAYYYDSYPDHRYRDHRGYHRHHHQAHRTRVPRDAEVVANGQGGLAYRPDRPGRVYVRDEKTGRVVYSGRVQPGQDVRVGADARGRRVSVDGRTARGDLSRRPREREVYFRPDRGSAPSPRDAAPRAERREAARAERAERAAERSERAAERRESRSSGKGRD